MTTRDIMLYIHIPFCRRRCNYCSFVSHEGREADIPAYVDAIKSELAQQARGQRACTIYFGGGTPSLLSPQQVGDLMLAIRSLYKVDEAAEVTLEANPGTVDEAYLSHIRQAGINRISLGVQSLDDAELALLGRLHTAAAAREAVRFAREAGFANLSIDLIYGLPGATPASWRRTLEEAIDLRPEHLSLYPLTLEDHVPMRGAIDRGELPALDSDSIADQYELAQDLLAAADYHHYEISNWAKPGLEGQHNMAYWRCLPYIGVGVAAHSHIEGHRFANTTDLDKYLEASKYNTPPPRDTDETIAPEMQLSEAVIMGLRLVDGLGLDDMQHRFGVDLLSKYDSQINELAILGLLEYDGQHLRLTRRGRLLGNEVFWRFLPE